MVNKVDVLVRLFETIEKRSKEDPSKSYTAKLLSEGKASCIYLHHRILSPAHL